MNITGAYDSDCEFIGDGKGEPGEYSRKIKRFSQKGTFPVFKTTPSSSDIVQTNFDEMTNIHTFDHFRYVYREIPPFIREVFDPKFDSFSSFKANVMPRTDGTGEWTTSVQLQSMLW